MFCLFELSDTVKVKILKNALGFSLRDEFIAQEVLESDKIYHLLIVINPSDVSQCTRELTQSEIDEEGASEAIEALLCSCFCNQILEQIEDALPLAKDPILLNAQNKFTLPSTLIQHSPQPRFLVKKDNGWTVLPMIREIHKRKLSRSLKQPTLGTKQ